MPCFVVADAGKVEAIVAGGGINKNTTNKRARAVGYVTQFLAEKENPSDFESFIELAATGNCAPLKAALIDFFASFRVSGPDGSLQLAKRGTVDCTRSHVKVHILNATAGKINISTGSVFKRLERFFSGHFKQLKEAGKGDVRHTPGTLFFRRNL